MDWIRRQLQLIWCAIKKLQSNQGIQSIQEGENITVDNTDPLNPVVSSTGGGGGGTSVHNDLTGLQGGQAGQYYHLTQEEYENFGEPMTNITYSELKTKRDNSELIVGHQYRITDYVTTVGSQIDYANSAGNPFDIIVIADSENKLNEGARAIRRNGDTYFPDYTKFESWELKYSLDNDELRYEWADSTNGKGVIYWLKDENNNECPYDFKNIRFKRYRIISIIFGYESYYELLGRYYSHSETIENFTVNSNDFIFIYTFYNETTTKDISTFRNDSNTDYYKIVNNNTIEKNIHKVVVDDIGYDLQKLNNSVFSIRADRDVPRKNKIGFDFERNTLGDSYDNIFGNDIQSNIFGNGIQSNRFGDNIGNNIFGNDIQSNTFGNNIGNNIFGKYIQSNRFGNNIQSNRFGNDMAYNTFGNNIQSNTFGNSIQSNTFRGHISSNTFGNGIKSNRFGSNIDSNRFGSYISNNTFSNDINNNKLGDNIESNIFGNNIQSNRFGNDIQSNRFGNKIHYNTFSSNLIGCYLGDGISSVDYESTGIALVVENGVKGGIFDSQYYQRLDITSIITQFTTPPKMVYITKSATSGTYIFESRVSANNIERFDYVLPLNQ